MVKLAKAKGLGVFMTHVGGEMFLKALAGAGQARLHRPQGGIGNAGNFVIVKVLKLTQDERGTEGFGQGGNALPYLLV
jgi:hypothetical protein